MSQFNNYHIALIAVLALNLIFWLLVICFRLFFNCSSEEPLMRQRPARGRRLMRGRRHPQLSRNSSNGSLIGADNAAVVDHVEHADHFPYNITGGLDAPPTYEDATKHHPYRPREPVPPQYVDSLQRPSPIRRPMVYEQPVVLMVPEEPTSTSEQRFISSLNPSTQNTTIARIIHEHGSPAGVQGLSNSNLQPHLPCLEEEDTLSINEMPITFVIEDIGVQAARLTGATCVSTELTDGPQLETQSKA